MGFWLVCVCVCVWHDPVRVWQLNCGLTVRIPLDAKRGHRTDMIWRRWHTVYNRLYIWIAKLTNVLELWCIDRTCYLVYFNRLTSQTELSSNLIFSILFGIKKNCLQMVCCSFKVATPLYYKNNHYAWLFLLLSLIIWHNSVNTTHAALIHFIKDIIW